MASLKELRVRIASVQSTQKITSAMKMVAASRLRKAQEMINLSKPFTKGLETSLCHILSRINEIEGETGKAVARPDILKEREKDEKDKVSLLLVFSSDRGLCGGFNSSVVKEAKNLIKEYTGKGRQFKVICVGRKARDLIKFQYPDAVFATYENIGKKGAEYSEAKEVGLKIKQMFDNGEIDECIAFYNTFVSAITQTVVQKQILPMSEKAFEAEHEGAITHMVNDAFYEFEPDADEMLGEIAEDCFFARIFEAMVQSQASEHGARMTSMDNATRNAGDMINNLTLTYNRTRQACITTELIEIISGAEAL